MLILSNKYVIIVLFVLAFLIIILPEVHAQQINPSSFNHNEIKNNKSTMSLCKTQLQLCQSDVLTIKKKSQKIINAIQDSQAKIESVCKMLEGCPRLLDISYYCEDSNLNDISEIGECKHTNLNVHREVNYESFYYRSYPLECHKALSKCEDYKKHLSNAQKHQYTIKTQTKNICRLSKYINEIPLRDEIKNITCI